MATRLTGVATRLTGVATRMASLSPPDVRPADRAARSMNTPCDARGAPIPYARSMLVILIPVIWLGVLSFALTMARLAAVSDDARAAAIAEHMAAIELSEAQHTTTEGRVEQRRFDRRREACAGSVGDADEELERDGSRIRIK